MIGFSGIQITKIVFSKEAIERNEKQIIAFGVGMVLLSAAIGLGIYELNIESTHRNIQIIAGAIIYFLATIAFFKTVLAIGKGEVILVSPNLYYHTVTHQAVALSPEGIISGTCYRVERSHRTNVQVESNV